MKRILKFGAVVALLISLNSCGIPGAMGRTVGRAYEGLDRLATSANN
jgi:hypothetical protein